MLMMTVMDADDHADDHVDDDEDDPPNSVYTEGVLADLRLVEQGPRNRASEIKNNVALAAVYNIFEKHVAVAAVWRYTDARRGCHSNICFRICCKTVAKATLFSTENATPL